MRPRSLVVIDGEAAAAVDWQSRSLDPAVSSVVSAVGPPVASVAAPVDHLNEQVPLALRVQHDRPRRYGVCTGVVGNRRAAAQRLEAEPRGRRRDRQSGQAGPPIDGVQRD